MAEFTYMTRGVCARAIRVALDDTGETIEDVEFFGGCPGNLAAIPKLVKGRPVDEVAGILKGNDCAGRGTSCADQLASALLDAKAKVQAGATA